MRTIESAQNAKYKVWMSLHESRGIKKHNLCLISGEKYISEIWSLVKDKAEVLCYNLEQAKEYGFPEDQCYLLSPGLHSELNPFNSKSPLIICPVPEIKAWDNHSDTEGLELFLPLGEPSNLGATLRSAEAFGASKVVLLEEAAHPFHYKSIKASSGSVFRVPLYSGPSINSLRGFFAALDSSGENINNYNWVKNTRVLIGEEAKGVPQKIKQTAQLLKIPMTQNIESLSAPIAASLALNSYYSQQMEK